MVGWIILAVLAILILLVFFLPYGVDVGYADEVIAFWDGSSRGTRYVIEHCKKRGKKVAVYQMG